MYGLGQEILVNYKKKISPFSRVKSAGNGIERLLCCLGAYQEIELVQALIFLLATT